MNAITTELTYSHFPARVAAESSEAASPALILLHGRGTDENDLTGLIPFLDARFEVYSIRAPFEFEYGGYTWFTLNDIEGAYNKEELDRSLSALIDFVKQLKGDGGRKVFLFGFSMGAMMSFAASLTAPELFAGVVAHSGLVPEQAGHLALRWKDLDACAFFIAHGIYDPVVSIQHGRRARDLFVRSNAHHVYKEYPMGHEISPESLADAASWLSRAL